MCAMQVNQFDSSDEEPLEEEQTPFQNKSMSILNICCNSIVRFFSSFVLDLGCRFKNIKRNLQKDIDELKSDGVLDVFVLCTKGELTKYRVPHLMETYQNYGITVHHHPIPDGGTPDIARCCVILNELRNCLESKRKATIHCYGGLGRSCLIAACLLLQVSDNITPQQAIDCMRELRGSGAIQTLKQYNYLHDFQETLAAYLATESERPRSVSR
uniref:Cyclin-dependent kinase inhibitor 3 n=1 Tax=Pseudonaja textilis TaxID=8673 RepID=A0A670XSX5_PSETE